MFLAVIIVVAALGFLTGVIASTKSQTEHRVPAQLNKSFLRFITPWQIRSAFPELVGEKSAVDQEDPGDSRGLLTKPQVEGHYVHGTWQRETYEEFRHSILGHDHGTTFPCVYATQGYRANDHRYVFLHSDDPSQPRNIHLLGPALKSYLALAHELGPNTSLVIISQPSNRERTVDEYNTLFWNVLRGLRIYDTRPWPSNAPSETSDACWTFCFDGEPIFPIALTPAHEERWSRHASTLIIAIQPRWVIDNLMSTPERREDATSKVRGLLRKYDRTAVSPHLASYGLPGTSESQQLVLGDSHEKIRVLYADMDG